MSNNIVVKSNRLVEACYRLGLVEQRIVLFAIVQAHESGRGLSSVDFVSITATDYAALFKENDINNVYASNSRSIF